MKILITFLLFLLAIYSNAKESTTLFFTQNIGQVADQHGSVRNDIDYVVHSDAVNVFIGKGKLYYQFWNQDLQPAYRSGRDIRDCQESSNLKVEGYRMEVSLVNASINAASTAVEKLPYYERHYKPHIDKDAAIAYTYNKIIYKDVYPHIDWVIYVKEGHLEYEFIVREGGNLKDIQLRYDGATALRLNADGSLTASTPMGEVTEQAPYSYTAGNNKEVASSFQLRDNILSFVADNYTGTLIVDPALVWGTYYGGVPGAPVRSVAHDHSGGIYIAGGTQSVSDIATIGSYQSSIAGPGNAFLVKFDTLGVRLWGTYYGGNTGEGANDISVDGAGNIYIVGDAHSSNGVATVGSHQQTIASERDGFLAKFSSSGALLWGTYFGGDTSDVIQAVTNDNAGNVFIAGFTRSANNIATTGSHQPIISHDHDAFLAKFDGNGVLQWSTYYGDTSGEAAYDLCVDNNGNVYMSGFTASASNIATPGSHQDTLGGGGDNFLVKFDGQGQRLWGTYYGGSGTEQATSVAYDGFGHIYMGSWTTSPNGIATPGSHQPNLGMALSIDAYLVQFDENGVRQWGTYYGHWGSEAMSWEGKGITTDDSGNVFFAIGTSSDSLATPCTHQQARAGYESMLVKMNSSGVRQWASYYGGTGADGVTACTYYAGSIYLAGASQSPNGIATPGSHDDIYIGGFYDDGVLARFTDCETPGQPMGIGGLSEVCEGDTVTYSTGVPCHATSYTWTLPNGWTMLSSSDTLIVALAGSSGTISVTANSACGASPAQTLAVTVNPAPVPVITESGTLLSTGTYVSYQWYLYGTAIAGATGQTYLTTQGGHYTVTVTDSNGCTGTSDVLPLWVKEAGRNAGVAIYPNPATGKVTVQADMKNATLTVVNVIGQVILQENMINSKTYSFDISKYANGVYIVELNREGVVYREKVLKN